MKIVKTEQEKLIFNDGSEITSDWYSECCEYNYADFTQIDDLAKEWEICYDTPITNDVLGYLTPEEVTEYMIEVQTLERIEDEL